MSDNFGSGQPRVLTVSDRNLDQVVFQQGRPPLTSEWNLINQISDLKSQQNIKINSPSGWLKVGDIQDTGATSTGVSVIAQEAQARSGQVLTSLTYGSCNFKFVSKDYNNIAVVNGWPIVVQNDSTPLLTLPNVTNTYRYDIVFLEVWKKLVSYGDPIYPYGNVKALPVIDNEILWNVIGAETTKRVQIQYRIRTAPNSQYNNGVDPFQFPEGLGWSNINPIGGNTEGSYVTSYSFATAGQSDIGLYIAGDGSPTAKTSLNTVDGYVYAIPMFLVYRRAYNTPFSASNIHNSAYAWSDAASSLITDRPDGQYADVVYPEDFIDVRHQVVTSNAELDSIFKESFRKLTTGDLNTTLGKGFAGSNTKIICSGGNTLLKAEQLNGISVTLPNIGTGVSTSDFKRRAYSKAGLISDHNVFQVPINGTGIGTTWNYGIIPISDFFTSAIGEIVSIDGLYFIDSGVGDEGTVPNWSPVGTTAIDIQISMTPPFFSGRTSSCKVYMEFTFQYYANNGGFYDVPKKFYEATNGNGLFIATRDQNIPVEIGTTPSDVLNYCGGNYTENSNFGMEYVYNTTIPESNNTISVYGDVLNNLLVLNGYSILGVKSVQVFNGVSYGSPETIVSIQNSGSGSYQITINRVVSLTSNIPVIVKLYIGYNYGDTKSYKFFELSKQGRGIIDTYEMFLYTANQTSPGSGRYIIDTVDKPIIAIGTYTHTDNSGNIVGQPYVFNSTSGGYSSINITETTINSSLPVLEGSAYTPDLLPTRITVGVVGAGSSVLVPVLVHSYVTITESPYTFYYRLNPYQGLLGLDIEKGKIEKEGSAIITSEGCGAINNFTVNTGLISITQAQRTVIQSGDILWTQCIKAGDYLNITGHSYYYRILSVDSDVSLTLAELYVENTVISQPYSIIRMDIPNTNISNIFERMPSYDSNDYLGIGTDINTGILNTSIIETNVKSPLQDPLDTEVNDFQLGNTSPNTNRGRSNFVLTSGINSSIKLGELTPYINYGTLSTWPATNGYKKVYQSYLYNESYYDGSYYRDLTGRVYLLVVSSETNQNTPNILLSGLSSNDTVDIFELKGRPIIKTT
jgi:hypothetical protein